MKEVKKITYIDFLGNEYDEEDKIIALEQENKNLLDIAKIVMFACNRHDIGCNYTDENGVKHFCPFCDLSGECIFRKRFGDYIPADWEFEDELRLENGNPIEEIFDWKIQENF